MYQINCEYELKRNELGFSLIELLLAILLCSLLFAFLIELFLMSEHKEKLQIALIQHQHQVVITMHILEQEIKKAGFIGCARLTKDFPLASHTFYSITTSNKLMGSDHEMTLRHAGEKNTTLIEPSQAKILQIKNHYFNAGDILLISDCKNAEIIMVHHVINEKDKQKIIPAYPLLNHFTQEAEVFNFEINKYFIDKSQAGTSLFVEDIHHHKTRLIDDVRRLQMVYVVQSGEERSASAVTDWSKVIGVDIQINFVSHPFQKTRYLYVSLAH